MGSQRVEKIAVIYEKAKRPKPVWFALQGEKYTIQEICYYWQSHEGRAIVSHYSIQTDKGLFKLIFNPVDQSWQILEGSNILQTR